MAATLGPETALLVVDVQRGFDEPLWGARNNPRAEETIGRLLAAWRSSGRPVLHVQHLSRSPGSPLAPGLPGSEIKPVARPLAGEPVFSKHVNSAFIGTELESHLREHAIQGLVVVGLTTDHCVSTTVRMAGNLGFDTWVVSDATATFDRVGPAGESHTAEQIHAVALASLHGEFATVVSAEQLLDLFARSARAR